MTETNFAAQPKQWLSMTHVITTLADALFEGHGKKFNIIITQVPIEKGVGGKMDRSVTLCLGTEPLYKGKTLAYLLDHVCNTIGKARKKLPPNLLKNGADLSAASTVDKPQRDLVVSNGMTYTRRHRTYNKVGA